MANAHDVLLLKLVVIAQPYLGIENIYFFKTERKIKSFTFSNIHVQSGGSSSQQGVQLALESRYAPINPGHLWEKIHTQTDGDPTAV